MTEGAQIAEQPEADVRTTVTNFSGQRNLGWQLRKPTSTTADPGGLELRHATTYDATTGNVTESRTPGAFNEEWGYTFKSSFGTFGTGNGQFHGPAMDAVDATGNVWVTDSANNRIEKFSSTGAYITQVGTSGSGNGQFLFVGGIAVNQSTGNVYVSDEGNGRIEEFSSTGTFIAAFGTEGSANGQFEHPVGIAIDSSGNVWVADYYNNRVQKFSSSGTYISQFGTAGSGNGQLSHPTDVEFAGGNVYVADYGNNRIEEFSTAGAYLGQFGSSGEKGGQFTEPESIALEPNSGNLYVADTGNGRIEVFTQAGEFIEAMGSYGSGAGQMIDPGGVAFNAAGNMYVTDHGNNRVQIWAPVWAPSYSLKFGSLGATNGLLSKPGAVTLDSSGNVWVADTENNRVEEFNSSGTFVRTFGTLGSGSGQLNKPEGIAIDSEGEVWVADTQNNRLEEFTPSGSYLQAFGTAGTALGQFNHPTGIVFAASGFGYILDTGNNRVQECIGTFCIGAHGSAGSGNGQFNAPEGIAADASGNLWIADGGNNRIQELSSTGMFIQKFGTLGSGNGQLNKPEGIALDAEGNVWVADGGNNRVQEFSSAGAYTLQMGVKGTEDQQFEKPAGIAFTKGSDFYVLDTLNSRVQKWHEPAAHESTGNGGTHGSQIVYYTVGANSQVAACGSHAEWANLPCQSQPATQPETAGVPNLPVTKYTYNIWDEPLTRIETVGASTRTTTNTYDGAGRLLTTVTTSSTGTALPTITNEYSSTTGLLLTEHTTVEATTKTLTNVFNSLGQLTEYTDADGNTSSYTYDIDGRMATENDGKGVQTRTYNSTSGYLASLADSAAGTFTATYTPDGRMLSEGYPNGMQANYAYDSTGQPMSVEYVKITHCTSGCTWYSDAITASIHGQAQSQSSSLSGQSYSYDNVGRLTETKDTPTGQGCTTRVYSYDPDSNRTSLIVRAPGVGGVCTGTGGTTEAHVYDTADRLLDSGVSYDANGNITVLPAADAGGSTLTSSYYVDNQLQSQTQNGQTIGYNLDPAGRAREVVSTGNLTATEIYHYAGSGSESSWRSEPSAQWTRNITGIDGGLGAVQHNGETPVLQVTNLHGDIVATALLSETATALASSGDSTEFGVPRNSLPPKYSWLGSHEVPTELASGVMAMGMRSYVPQLGRFLQTDPLPGGSPNAYAYTNGDPVGESDLTGAYSATISASLAEGIFEEAAQIAAQKAAEEAAARAAAEAAAEAAAAEAEGWGGFGGNWEFEDEEYEYEEEYEEGYGEYASWLSEDIGLNAHTEFVGNAGAASTVKDAIVWTPAGGSQAEGSTAEVGPGRRDVKSSCAFSRRVCAPLAKPHPRTQCRRSSHSYHPPPTGPTARPGPGAHNEYCPSCEAQEEAQKNLQEWFAEKSLDKTEERLRQMRDSNEIK